MFFEIEKLTFCHSGTPEGTPPALKNISLKIEEGEWVALIGANGSGKTTLARHLDALLQPTSGRVLVDGLDTSLSQNLPQIRSKVGMVFQAPEDQIVANLVIEDTAFGLENLAVKHGQIKIRTESALKTVEMWEERERAPHLLSAGQIQRVALAGVLAMQPRCIVFDETTAMLDPLGKRTVLEQMSRLHEQGITVVMITHSMDEAELAERVLLLNAGELVYDGVPAKLFAETDLLKRCHLELPVSMQAQNLLQRYFPSLDFAEFNLYHAAAHLPSYKGNGSRSEQIRKTGNLPNDLLIEVSGLHHTYFAGTPLAHPSLNGVNMNTYAGSTHGLVGATGSGKSTLLQHLNGLFLPSLGKVRVGKFETDDPGVDLRGLRHFAGFVFQNPENYFFEQYVGDEIAYGAKLYYGRGGLRERVRTAMETVGLDFDLFKDRFTSTLSGGEKRKVALAAMLVVQPELLILDEPSAGLDPLSRHNLLTTLGTLQNEGRSIMLSSHNMEDIASLAQHVTVMGQGKDLASDTVGTVFSNQPLLEESELAAPVGMLVTAGLRANGWPISTDAVTLESVEHFLQNELSGRSE